EQNEAALGRFHFVKRAGQIADLLDGATGRVDGLVEVGAEAVNHGQRVIAENERKQQQSGEADGKLLRYRHSGAHTHVFSAEIGKALVFAKPLTNRGIWPKRHARSHRAMLSPRA